MGEYINQSDRCRIAELEARVLRLTTELRTPHPERDFVRECNELLAAKDAKISELEATITTLKAEKNQAINDAFDAELAHEVALREIESLKAKAAAERERDAVVARLTDLGQ